MDKSVLITLRDRFNGLSRSVPDKDLEFCLAWDLTEPLGNVRGENVQSAIKRTIKTLAQNDYCNQGYST
jgi:hypothetical protein